VASTAEHPDFVAGNQCFNAADPEQLNFSLRKSLSNICGDIPTPGCPAGVAACGAGSTCPAGINCASGCCFPIIQ
jgi:hypothetical protein